LKSGEKILFNDNDDARKMMESCPNKGRRVINPIVDWSDQDVWRYIKERGIEYCKLYDIGFTRLGCIGCPMARGKLRLFEFKYWPRYYKNYLKAFDKMLQANIARKGQEAVVWKTAQDVMDWWIYEMPKEDPSQLKMFDQDDF
jgi:phosphoadenosine phosphosulfate reductase